MPPRARHLVSSAGYSLSSYFHSNKFFCQFVSYTFVVTSVAAVLFTALQANSDHTISLFDAWFLAISCFSCTGLATVEYYEFRVTTLVVMLLTIELGNMVMCSAGPSMLRLLTLHRKLDEVRNAEDSAEVRTYERKIVLQVIVNRTIVWFCTVYVLAAHTVLFLLVLAAGQTGWWALFHTVTGLNNAGFALQKESFATPSLSSNEGLLYVFILGMPMGNTLYPVYQRLMLFGVQTVLRKMDLTATSHWYLFGMSTMDLSIGLTELFANPRRYYTHLYGKEHTNVVILLWLVVALFKFSMFLPCLQSKMFVGQEHKMAAAFLQSIGSFTTVRFDKAVDVHIFFLVGAMYMYRQPFIVTEQLSRPRYFVASSVHPRLRCWGDILYNARRDIALLSGAVGIIFLCGEAARSPPPVLQVAFVVASAFSALGWTTTSSSIATSCCASRLSQLIIICVMLGGKFRGTQDRPWTLWQQHDALDGDGDGDDDDDDLICGCVGEKRHANSYKTV
eukprot:PhM_4_TR3072/c2_g2_i11/m.102572